MTGFAFVVWMVAIWSDRNQSSLLSVLCFFNWLNLLFS
jgi:hypothetical protein